jgi:hypothetical protein
MSNVTPSELRTAADILERWAERSNYAYVAADVAAYSAKELRIEAGHLENEIDEQVTLKVTEWKWIDDVDDYAINESIELPQAIERLVHKGLEALSKELGEE